jgi:hypothetical protein
MTREHTIFSNATIESMLIVLNALPPLTRPQ